MPNIVLLNTLHVLINLILITPLCIRLSLSLFLIRNLKHRASKWCSQQMWWSENCLVVSDSLWPHWLYSQWNSPGQNTGVGTFSLLQGIFPSQGLNPGFLLCRQIFYQLSHQGNSQCFSNCTDGDSLEQHGDAVRTQFCVYSIHYVWFREHSCS